jgi:flagellar protein FlgJ
MATIQPAGAPDAAALADPATAKIWKAAQDFEAMALGALLAPVFDTVDATKGAFGGGDGEKAWRPMLTQELARHMAGHGGLGLAAPVFRQMLHMQEAAQAAHEGRMP